MRRILLFSLIILAVGAQPSSAFMFGQKYYIIFEKTPNIISDKITFNNIEIGKVQSKKLGNSNIVIATIKVKNKYTSFLKTNTVFYVDEGQLVYDTIDDLKKELPPKSRILGFADKTDLLWFKTKNKIRILSNAAVKKAEELYSQYKRVLKPSRN